MARYFGNVELGGIELFCLAAEQGSFTRAAQAAGISPAAVSRAMGRLEARLGVRLFVRTTRSLRLTDSGQTYLQHCQGALESLKEVERELSGAQQQPAGTIRLSVPTTYGHARILPLLPAFQRRYPQVRFDIHVGNRNVDLMAEGYDLVVRARPPADSGLVARPLEQAELVVVASPEYLATRGAPQNLGNLDDHQCIQFLLPRTGRHVAWLFMENGQETAMLTRGDYQCQEDVSAGIQLARAGAGLYQTYRFMVEAQLAQGELHEVLQPYAGCARPFSLLYARDRLLSQPVRLFIDYLLDSVPQVNH
ncbi:MAG: LysR family transcriptional regulator [Alcanivoracaceae bacterium]|uniref:LysR family transcriptional regulator n=1 Tax=Alcanivorax profundi TaxID=2338368 RepID=A0A418Y004_9GAMM|nr:LysR family transcriptional regulator [Alcanivorax profundi]MAX56020.1 LysR family transcriptional regulator [Alcanivoracaceae bacterium]RJG18595.1 LysR family transcriptional regulator [Alcanivorax profundi]|tara:strand:+ start:1150 stop:2070 length:921 start_codon:yes stop_codon:yes gene_type:complete